MTVDRASACSPAHAPRDPGCEARHAPSRESADGSTSPGSASRQYWSAVLGSGGCTAIPRWTLQPVAGVGTHDVAVAPDLAASLRNVAAASGVPLGSVVLAAHAKVLAALSGETSVSLGYVPDDGGRPLPCRLMTEAPSWTTLLSSSHRVATEIEANSGYPLDDLRSELGLLAPAFEVVFDAHGRSLDLAAETVLAVDVTTDDGELRLTLRYRTDALDAGSAARIAGYHLAALAALASDPAAPHARRSLLSADERHFLIEGLAGPRRDLPDLRFHELFEQQARTHPDSCAAVCGADSLTYRELDARANMLGRALLAHGLSPEGIVAVVSERNLGWLAAVIAVFKAGGVYMPIEPHFPADRITAMLARSECALVLAARGSTNTLEAALQSRRDVQTLFIDEALQEGHEDDELGLEVTPDQLAYIYFTSGSTGEPKGAMCEQRGMLNHLLAKIEDLGITEGQVVAQVAPQCFDISLWQLVGALLVGGQTLIIEQDVILDAERFVDTIIEHHVSVAQVVPSYLEVVLSYLNQHPRELPDLRCVSVTGEALTKELAERWFAAMPAVRLVNAYGLTETSDDTNHEVMERPPEGDRVPLGRAINNAYIYVVDEDLAPVPLGAPGEIVFSGICVGRGYINDPERTCLAYGPDPLRPGERLYRSGDYGRWRPDGKLEFLGRRDAQVKIRGFRIEIGDIESALLRVPGVRNGAVVVADRADGSQQLAAFYSGPEPLEVGRMQQQLGEWLPEYMVPAAIRWLEDLPLTANGKIDRKRLRPMAAEPDPAEASLELPTTPTERRLASAWASVLSIPQSRIGRRDSFLDLGGTSLSAVRLAVALDREVSLTDVTSHPVLADLAALMDGLADAEAGLVQSPGTGPTASSSLDPVGRVPTLHTSAGGDAPAWAAEHRAALRAMVTEHGSVLVRGLGLAERAEVEAVFRSLAPELTIEREAFEARGVHAEGVYTASRWTASQQMCSHHELSYRYEVPGLIMFACLVGPTAGGETGVADAAVVLEALPAQVTARFEQAGWMLVRSYNDEIGASIGESFGTDDRAAVEAYCRAQAIEFEWQLDGGLRTRQRRNAVVRHPLTGQRCWFNQVAFLNEWTLEPEVREYLLEEYGAEGLPFNTQYGNGDPIGADIVELINETYEANIAREALRAGDLMLIDNIRTAHSRGPFEGEREVLVAMSDPVHLS